MEMQFMSIQHQILCLKSLASRCFCFYLFLYNGPLIFFTVSKFQCKTSQSPLVISNFLHQEDICFHSIVLGESISPHWIPRSSGTSRFTVLFSRFCHIISND